MLFPVKHTKTHGPLPNARRRQNRTRHNAEKGTPTFALTDPCLAQTYPFLDSPTAHDKPIKPPTFRLAARCFEHTYDICDIMIVEKYTLSNTQKLHLKTPAYADARANSKDDLCPRNLSAIYSTPHLSKQRPCPIQTLRDQAHTRAQLSPIDRIQICDRPRRTHIAASTYALPYAEKPTDLRHPCSRTANTAARPASSA